MDLVDGDGIYDYEQDADDFDRIEAVEEPEPDFFNPDKYEYVGCHPRQFNMTMKTDDGRTRIIHPDGSITEGD